jgi:hypothetical protein
MMLAEHPCAERENIYNKYEKERFNNNSKKRITEH